MVAGSPDSISEHYEEAVENTPARILETHHHGAGGYYRQCFYNRELDYKKYDEMFYHTVAEDTEETAVELALDRLRFPEELSEKNKMSTKHTYGSIWKRWQRIW